MMPEDVSFSPSYFFLAKKREMCYNDWEECRNVRFCLPQNRKSGLHISNNNPQKKSPACGYAPMAPSCGAERKET